MDKKYENALEETIKELLLQKGASYIFFNPKNKSFTLLDKQHSRVIYIKDMGKEAPFNKDIVFNIPVGQTNLINYFDYHIPYKETITKRLSYRFTTTGLVLDVETIFAKDKREAFSTLKEGLINYPTIEIGTNKLMLEEVLEGKTYDVFNLSYISETLFEQSLGKVNKEEDIERRIGQLLIDKMLIKTFKNHTSNRLIFNKYNI